MKLKEIAFDLRGMQALKLSKVMFLTQLLKKVENGAAGAHGNPPTSSIQFCSTTKSLQNNIHFKAAEHCCLCGAAGIFADQTRHFDM